MLRREARPPDRPLPERAVAPLQPLLARLATQPALAAARRGGDVALAVPGPAQAAAVAALADRATGPLLVVTATTGEAERLAGDLRCWIGLDQGAESGALGATGTRLGDVGFPVALLPAWDTLPFERVSPDVQTMGRRRAVLWHLVGDGADRPAVVVASVRAAVQTLAMAKELQGPLVLAPGERVDATELVEQLVGVGYRREHQVEHHGEIAVRGGIIDVFPSTSHLPVRVDLWGDEVDRLTSFDVGDQRSVEDLPAAVIFPCHEMVLSAAVRWRAEALVDEEPWGRSVWERLARGEQFDGMESWLPWLQGGAELLTDYLPVGSRVVLIEPRRLRDRSVEICDEEGALVDALASTWGFTPPPVGGAPDGDEQEGIGTSGDGPTEVSGDGPTEVSGDGSALPRLHQPFNRLLSATDALTISISSVAPGPDMPAVSVRGFERVAGDPGRLAAQVTRLLGDEGSVTLCATTADGAGRLSKLLADEGIVAPVVEETSGTPGARVVVAGLSQGFSSPEANVSVLAEPDITGRRMPHRAARPRARPTTGFFDDLASGSFVVHRQHGVARFSGVTTRTVAGTVRDYLVLEFRGSDRLYLPVDQIEAITPYSGGETPTLSRMGGAEWQRTRARARAAASEVAQELVQLYRDRLQVEGHAFAPDTPWQRDLESAFPYVETTDQLKAVVDVKADMEQPRPMDRLVCGDVGFGKTEVAVRAVFKAVQDGKQAAVLVPTTLLASQHHQTFADRFANFPVRLELLSRFLTPGEANRVVRGVADGSVDVVVGTHRLLTGDVRFRDLGLLVVDEEQRFGVTHKEAIKQLAHGVDVLTLTASPIPRTLEMALTGIRDLSVINTPPADRRPILTYVGEREDAAVSEALRRELLRDGQAFFVHNRVVDIEAVAERIRSLVPEARVAVAHGRMDEGSLERVVLDFSDRSYDVLVCTTIIESGIDMPSVNTLVVDRADLLGLGQLHQIRGRVGRSDQRAYAYLLHPADRVLTEQAYERLKTVGEHTELGSGFRIAMRDLEIRGAGNLLGSDQSGHIAAVGYDLYVQLVAEAVAEAKGEARPEAPTVNLDVPGDAHLPDSYVPGEDTRLEAYRRLSSATTLAEVQDVADEWVDRFGPPPDAAQGLLALARLRAECARAGIKEVTVTARAGGGGRPRPANAKLSPVHLGTRAEVRLRRLAPDSRYRPELEQLVVPLATEGRAADQLRDLVAELLPLPASETSTP